MPKRFFVTADTTIINGKLVLNALKKPRLDESQVVPDIDNSDINILNCNNSGNNNNSSNNSNSNVIQVKLEIPVPGTKVNRRVFRKAGPYIIGPSLGHSPSLDCMVQYLARKENSKEFYQLKILYINDNPLNAQATGNTKSQDDERTGKMFLFTECSLLSILNGEEGVIQQHGLFWDTALEEEYKPNFDVIEDNSTTYTGRTRKRLILVLDSVTPHKYNEKSAELVNLQQYLKEGKIKENEALQIFYEIVKVIERLHKKNVIHRDLKIANIVLNRRTKKIILTNFSLGKQLLNENELLNDKVGTPNYISPDVLSHQPYKGKPSDMWTLGVVLYIMIYGKFPFFERTTAALFKKIKLGDYNIPADFEISVGAVKLIKGLLTLNPSERLSATDVRVLLEQRIHVQKSILHQTVDQTVPEFHETKCDEQQQQQQNMTKIKSSSLSSSQQQHSQQSQETGNQQHNLPKPTEFSTFSNQPLTISSQLSSNDDNHISNNSVKIKLTPNTRNPLYNSFLQSPFYNYQIRRVLIDRLSTLQLSGDAGGTGGGGASGGSSGNSSGGTTPTMRRLSALASLEQTITDAFTEQFERDAAALESNGAGGISSAPVPSNPTENLIHFNGTVTPIIAKRIISYVRNEFRSKSIVRFIYLGNVGDEMQKMKLLCQLLSIQFELGADGAIKIKREQNPRVLMFINSIFKGAGVNTSYFSV